MIHPFDQLDKYCHKHDQPRQIVKRQQGQSTIVEFICPDCEYDYRVFMELVKHPEMGVRPSHVIRCTYAHAVAKVGNLYSDNPEWRIVKVEMIGE